MKTDRVTWNLLKFGSLAVVLGFAPAVIWQRFHSEDWARYWWIILAPLIAIVLFLIWYTIFGKATVGKRLLRSTLGFLGIVGAFFTFGALFEYDGSQGGSSFPKYKFKYSKKQVDAAPLPTKNNVTANEARPGSTPEGLVDSPQFMGPNRDGHFQNAGVSLDFQTNPPEEMWRIAVGDGWSSFAVVGNQAITQEQRGEDELVTCYEITSGKLLWSHVDENSRFVTAAGEENRMMSIMGGEGPRSTPTVYNQHVYSLGSTGILNCLDLKTGELQWTRDTLAEFSAPLPRWGKSSAPLVVEEWRLIVVTAAEKNGPTLLAYQLDDGEPVWEYEGNGASYSSPRIIEFAGEKQLVSVNAFDVTGHDPARGTELWKFEWPRENPKVTQPVSVGDDRILVSSSYNMGTHLLQIRRNESDWNVEPVWKTTKLKTKFSSPLVKDGFGYGLNEGRLACIDLKSGDQKWRGGKYGFGQNLLVDDKILILAENGDIAVVNTNPEEFQEFAKVEKALTGMTWNAPTLAGQYLLVRNGKEAVCYRLSKK